MSDQEFEEEKARIKRFLEKWKPAGFGWWNIRCIWDRGLNQNDSRRPAEVEVQWPYRTADIYFYLPAVAELSDDDCEHMVVHELSHILIASASTEDLSADLLEFATENVTRALLYTSMHVRTEEAADA